MAKVNAQGWSEVLAHVCSSGTWTSRRSNFVTICSSGSKARLDRLFSEGRRCQCGPLRPFEHEFADQAEYGFWFLSGKHVPGIREAYEPQEIRWKRRSKLLAILDRHDRVQLTREQQHRAADLAEALGEVEAQDLAAEEVL